MSLKNKVMSIAPQLKPDSPILNGVKNSANVADNLERYQRQMMVSQLGTQGQTKLITSHVAIVGMGGLGCPASIFLAGAGVGTLTLIDHDSVSLTNLHRQVLYRESDVGLLKVDAAHRTLTELNSDIDVVKHAQRINADNITALLSDAEIIVDATDNFAISYMLSDYCIQHSKPLISASVMGVTGYVGVFCHSTLPSTVLNLSKSEGSACPSMRAVFPNPPPVGQDCNSVGVIGTAAGIMGTLQAQEVIKVILGDEQQLAGRLLSMDLWRYRQTIIDFTGAPEPDNYVHIIAEADIHKSQNKHHNKQSSQDWVVDVRSLAEVEQSPKFCHQHLPVSEVLMHPEQLKQLPKDKRLVFTCMSGQRALMVADSSLQSGFDNVAVWL